MAEVGKDKLISRDGWPDCYQARNTFKPDFIDTISKGIVASYYRALAGRGRDSTITPEE